MNIYRNPKTITATDHAEPPRRKKPKPLGKGLFPSVRQGLPVRCPTCRGKVYLPCRLCALRKSAGGVK